MKTKTLVWVVSLVCTGWYTSAIAALPAPSDATSAHDNAALLHSGKAVEVADDDELAQQRGKYLGASVVSGFMVEMATHWRNEAGQASAQARLLATDLNSHAANVVTNTQASVQMGVGSLSGISPTANASGGNGVQVNGVGQVTQVAGANNLASNTTSISIQTAPLPTLPSGSATANAAQNGFVAQAQAGLSGVQVAVSSPMGVASQAVSPGGAGIAGSVMQVAQLAGNAQVITNQLSIQLQVQTMSRQQLAQIGVAQALQSVAGLRR
ncbi:hypothetical protein [Ralstonia mannitolilytica]|uniref:hypothetical protein n=1 Tax=Ralstonia mannitolilytica TaxID=105219 RepID=UPI00242BEB7E|nr:hypothetical protein [Ralstonia mannitolilytica]CAJ0733441.1 hypothetical protein R76706_03254 [Ralstonia mannitolilytica]